MRKITCELKFKEGNKIIISLDAKSAQGEYLVNYLGAIERLPRKIEMGDINDVKAFCTNIALELNTELSVKEEGDYDSWAE